MKFIPSKAGLIWRLYAFLILGLLTLLLSALENQWWVGQVLANLRLHNLAALGLIVIALLFLKSWKVGLTGLGAVLVGMTWITLSVTKNVAKPAKTTSHQSFRMMSWNILSSNQNFDLVLNEIRLQDPDVLILMEVTTEWEPVMSALRKRYPFEIIRTPPGNFGIAMFSKTQPSAQRAPDFTGYGIPSTQMTLQIYDQEISIIGTHPIPPVRAEAYALGEQHRANLIKLLQADNHPMILAGDFNQTPWTAAYQKLLASTDLDRAAPAWKATWQAPLPFAALPLDHIFVSEHWSVSEFKVGPLCGSDHAWLRADLVLD
ncbi:MAG: endonuclease/exonuclease/phosphatase family protein [Verrucomicrobiota bacterium]